MSRTRTWNGSVAKALRLKHGLSPEELAARIGIHRATVYAWEAGTSAPQVRHAVSLADLYEVPLDVFFIPAGVFTPEGKGGASNANGSPATSAISS